MTFCIRFNVPKGRRRFLHSKAHAAVATWKDGEESLQTAVAILSVGVLDEDLIPVGDGDMTRISQIVIKAIANDIQAAQARLENLVPFLVKEFSLEKAPVIGCYETIAA